MTRQAWESTADGDLGFRSSGGGFLSSLSWWLLGLIGLGALTAGTAYYLPLHRAHRALSERYAALQKRTDVQDSELQHLRAKLASAEVDRQKLLERQSLLAARDQAGKDRSSNLRDALATRLAGFTKSHLYVVARDDGAAVMIPSRIVRMQGAELTPAGGYALCAIVKAMSAAGPLNYRVGTYVAHADASAAGPREQAASRAINAAKALEEKCAVPDTRILSAGFVQPRSPSGVGDVLELDVAPLDAPH
jgi:hypothetical protein